MKMWNILFLIITIQLYQVSSKSIVSTNDPFWHYPLNTLIKEVEIQEEIKNRGRNDNYYKSFFENVEKNINDRNTMLTSLKSSSSEKRALSMFARWRPLNLIGKERHPIRNNGHLDRISTQTRGRMMGQPLRWG